MQDKVQEIKVKSDVNLLLEENILTMESDIRETFKELKLKSLLKECNIDKRYGLDAEKMIFDLCIIPFLMLSNVFIFLSTHLLNRQTSKSSYYRFLENAKFNWERFIMKLSSLIFKKIDIFESSYFVVDDTIQEVSGKGRESVSYIYDHTKGKSVLGYQKLVLGVFTGTHFLPIIQKLCVSSKRPNFKSKATKIKKVSKVAKIDKDSQGAKERKEFEKNKQEKTFSMLKKAKRNFKQTRYVLFDSWFCFNSFIIKIKEKLDLQVVCQLKNLPKPNQYTIKSKLCSLKELYTFHAKPKMKSVRGKRFKQAVLLVKLKESNIPMKIVFIQNNGSDKWYAFGSTDTKISALRILEIYSQRWSIEVFFKNCKQYLNYGKDQMSNIDSVLASDAIVFLRYLLLTRIAFSDSSDFYSILLRNREQRSLIEYGKRLFDYFIDWISIFIAQIITLIENDKKEEALKLLNDFVINNKAYSFCTYEL